MSSSTWNMLGWLEPLQWQPHLSSPNQESSPSQPSPLFCPWRCAVACRQVAGLLDSCVTRPHSWLASASPSATARQLGKAGSCMQFALRFVVVPPLPQEKARGGVVVRAQKSQAPARGGVAAFGWLLALLLKVGMLLASSQCMREGGRFQAGGEKARQARS